MDTAGEGELRALELDADDSNGAFVSSRCRMTKTRGVIQASRVRAGHRLSSICDYISRYGGAYIAVLGDVVAYHRDLTHGCDVESSNSDFLNDASCRIYPACDT